MTQVWLCGGSRAPTTRTERHIACSLKAHSIAISGESRRQGRSDGGKCQRSPQAGAISVWPQMLSRSGTVTARSWTRPVESWSTRVIRGAGRMSTAQSERTAMRVSTGLPGTRVQGSVSAGRPPGSGTREAPGPETRIAVSVTGCAAALLSTNGMGTTGSPETTLMSPGSPAVAPSDTRTSTNPSESGADGRVSRKCIPAAPSRTPTATAPAVQRRPRLSEPPEIVSGSAPLPATDDQSMGSLSASGTTSRRYAQQSVCRSSPTGTSAATVSGAHIGTCAWLSRCVGGRGRGRRLGTVVGREVRDQQYRDHETAQEQKHDHQ